MPVPTPTSNSEVHVLKLSLQECKRKLDECRREGDELGADVCESDMNHMIERLAALGGATDDTEATGEN